MGEGISGDKMNAGEGRKRGDGRVKRVRGVGGESKQTFVKMMSHKLMAFAIAACMHVHV